MGSKLLWINRTFWILGERRGMSLKLLESLIQSNSSFVYTTVEYSPEISMYSSFPWNLTQFRDSYSQWEDPLDISSVPCQLSWSTTFPSLSWTCERGHPHIGWLVQLSFPPIELCLLSWLKSSDVDVGSDQCRHFFHEVDKGEYFLDFSL